MSGLLLSDDLIFTSRIVGTARDLGLEVRAARTLSQLEHWAEEKLPACLILDLHHSDLNIAELAPRFRNKGVTLVGYGSHVSAAVLKAARDAGCDVVWPRSKFVEELAAALPGWLGPP